MAREATLLALLIALGGTSWWLSRTAPPETPSQHHDAQRPIPAATPDPAPAVASALLPPPAPAPKQAERHDQLELPDGTFVATLNGATDPEPLRNYWGNFPWSPIVGVERSSAGVDWYKHADGSYSTTEVKYASPGNHRIVLTRVAHPTDQTAPVAPETKR